MNEADTIGRDAIEWPNENEPVDLIECCARMNESGAQVAILAVLV